jgi:20S proteasome alpha/beta subunit
MQYDAKAIGSGSEGAQTELNEEYHKVNIFNIIYLRILFV